MLQEEADVQSKLDSREKEKNEKVRHKMQATTQFQQWCCQGQSESREEEKTVIIKKTKSGNHFTNYLNKGKETKH